MSEIAEGRWILNFSKTAFQEKWTLALSGKFYFLDFMARLLQRIIRK